MLATTVSWNPGSTQGMGVVKLIHGPGDDSATWKTSGSGTDSDPLA
jgi:hypothetical protein